MRAIALGQPFMHITADDVPSPSWYGYPDCERPSEEPPVFSEANLYLRMTKDDARFVLAIADEYSALIEVLGAERIEELLQHVGKLP